MGQIFGFLFILAAWVSSIAAYITHILWGIKLLSAAVNPATGQIVLGVLGAVIPPVGVLHGWLLWFGVVI